MAFLGSVLGLVGSLVGGGRGGYASTIPANFDALQAQAAASQRAGLETQMVESTKMADTQRLITQATSQSSRSIMRASMLTDIVKQHEGLMQSIQSAESSHIKGSFDLIKNS